MDKTLLFLKEEANKIRKNQNNNFYFNSTEPLNIPIKSFLSLFDIIQKFNEDDLILGFCFSIGPYVSNNRSIIKSQYSHELWTNLAHFAEFISEPIQVFEFCKGVLITSFYCLSIDQVFLDFLLDQNPLRSKILKPSLLISLYSDFPPDFISFNSKVFTPIISEYFKESIPIHCIMNLYLANLLNFPNDEGLRNYPNFENNLWSSLYEIIFNDPSYFHSLAEPFFHFRKMNDNFFYFSNIFISSKIVEIKNNSYDDENMKKLLPLAYLLPFFSVDDVEKFMRKIIPIISLYLIYLKKIPKQLTIALNQSKGFIPSQKVAMKLYSLCIVYLKTEFYPAVIYFLSIFLSEFCSYYSTCFKPIIGEFADGLESTYPVKFPLSFSFFQNSESFSTLIHQDEEISTSNNKDVNQKICDDNHESDKNTENCECCHHHKSDENCECCHHHKSDENCECCHHHDECSENADNLILNDVILKDRIIPALFKISCSGNPVETHWSFKALREFLSANCVELFPSISYFLEYYTIKPEACINNDSFLCFHHFYKYLYHFINAIKSNKEQLNEIIIFIMKELEIINSEKFSNEETNSFLIKTDFCNLLKIITVVDFNNIDKYIEVGMNLAKKLIFSNYYKSYSSSIQLISLFYKRKKITTEKDNQKIIERSIQICNGEIKSNYFIQAEVSRQLSTFDFVKFTNVSSIAKQFIEINDKESKNLLNLSGLQIIEDNLTKMTSNEQNSKEAFELIANPFIDSIFSLLCNSDSEKVVNKAYSIFTTILESFKESNQKQLNYIEKVIDVTLLGRIRLFDHSMCFNYEFLDNNFKFFSLASHFIVNYPNEALSKRIVDDFSLWILRISEDVIPKLLKVLEIALNMKIIKSDMIQFLSEAIISRINEDNWKLKFVEPSILFLLKLKQKFSSYFPLDSLLLCLEKMWEENQDDNSKIIKFLIIIFLKIFSEKSFNVHGDFLVFKDISSIIVAETFELNYPDIINYYIEMFRNKIPFYSFDKLCGIVFAHFLAKNKSELLEIGFSNEILNSMHMYLKQIISKNKGTENFIENYFKNNQIAKERIKILKKSPKLPEFK